MALKAKKSGRDATLVSGGKMAVAAKCGRLAGIIMATAALVVIVATFSRAEDRKTRVLSFLASGTRTAATVQTTAFDVSAFTEGQIFIDVTAKVDNPTLDVTIQTSPDNNTWYTHTAMTQIINTGQYRQAITNFGKYIRLQHVVGATTSITYSATGVFKN
jgi:hypothetical protein